MTLRRRSTRANRRAPIRRIPVSSPSGMDPQTEYIYIRQDLIRILVIGAILLGLMIILAVIF